jgi:hypothetical protein
MALERLNKSKAGRITKAREKLSVPPSPHLPSGTSPAGSRGVCTGSIDCNYTIIKTINLIYCRFASSIEHEACENRGVAPVQRTGTLTAFPSLRTNNYSP